ncbi:hypothetical protein L2744_19010 [Shewanella profunda]|uniref:hypothetical protein n=1 Tax=Shewanella profunda TaxID=254793 RepID=UPI00200E0132|nr:hypothetical protein [Shewanella profunda]MCL1091653.1 hypothetical protein [Shewanella profunda]
MQTPIDTTKSTTEFKSKGLNNAIDEASAAAHPAIDNLSAKVHDTVDKLASAASQGVENFDIRSEQLNAQGIRLGNAVRGQIQRRPVAMLGAAVLVGCALSWLLKSRAD